MSGVGPVRVLFIGAGDIRRARGARSYLLSLVEGLRHAGAEVDAFFLQQLMPASGGAPREPVRTLVAPGARYASALAMPVLAWRLYEVVWAVWMGLRVALSHRTRCGVCLVTGPMLLVLTPLLRRIYPKLYYVEHGIAEELLLLPGVRGRVKYWAVRLAEHLFLRRFTAVATVSTRMATYFKRDGVTRHVLVPCGVHPQKFRYSAADRTRIRDALGVADRFVFVYSGGANAWHRRSEMIEVFRQARKSVARPFLLVLSADPAAWQNVLAPLEPGDYTLVSAPHEEVGQYLCAGDVAFLMRTRRLVDAVSCPVKFAEYLACGLPVLISPDIGDYTDLVERRRVGVVVDPDAPTTWDAALARARRLAEDPAVRDRCIRVAGGLSWNVVAARFVAAFSEAAPGAAPPERAADLA